MNDKQNNKNSMYAAINSVCAKRKDVWEGLPAFVAAFEGFQATLKLIGNATRIQRTKITGVTKNKLKVEQEMVDRALVVNGAVTAYATVINNNELKQKVNYSRTRLLFVRDLVTLSLCQTIHNQAAAVIDNLEDYGLTEADMEAFQELINAFKAVIVSPKMAILIRKGATSRLVKLMKVADGLLKDQMDRLMEQFKVSDPTFYNLYFNTRSIIDRGSRKTVVEGVVLDEATEENIVGATAELILFPNTDKEEIRELTTDVFGSFRFERMLPGLHKVRVSKPGYTNTELNVDVVRGKVSKLGILLRKEGDLRTPINDF